jgi:two-component system chemotaxis sensor kinase CheA
MRGREQLLRDVLDDATRSLSAMRLTTAGRLFARLTRTLEAEAARLGHVVAVQVRGAQEPLDRRLSEALLEPCMQLVRNAVAHGVESAAARAAIGKPPTGTITLSARRSQGRVTIVVADDGAGVNAAAVRARAVEAGHLNASAAEALDDAGIIALLLMPGLSTAHQSDLLAGRGMGLDIVQSAVRRIGGTLRLSSRRQEGFVARIEVPAESGLTKILWVEAGGETYALPATPARAVRIGGDPSAPPIAHLATCLDGHPRVLAPFAVDLEVRDEADEVQMVTIGVDAIGRTEDLLLRPLSPLVATLGPFAGAIVRGDGSLHLAIDVDALAPRVRNLASGARP